MAKMFLKADFFVVEDACRAISKPQGEIVLSEFLSEGVHVIRSDGPEMAKIADKKLVVGKRNAAALLPISERVVAETNVLCKCVRKGDLDTMCRILDSDDTFDIDALIAHGMRWSLLHLATSKGNVAVIIELLKRNADVNLPAMDGKTALMIAVKKNQREALDYLLSRDDVDFKIMSNRTGMSALMYACRSCKEVGIAASIIERTCAENIAFLQLRNIYGKTALMYACMHATEEGAHIVAQILRAAGDMRHRVKLVNQVDQEGWNAFHFACASGLFPLVNWVEIFKEEDSTAAIYNLPIDEPTKTGFTPLHFAAGNGHTSVIKALYEGTHGNKISMKHLININRKTDLKGDTAFDVSLRAGYTRCARQIARFGGHAITSTGDDCMSLLHRVILSHDEKTADGILNFSDENGLMRDRASSSALVKITQKMSYPETCTVDFTGFVGLNQYMYECEECSTRVCLVCMHTCHGKRYKVQIAVLDL